MIQFFLYDTECKAIREHVWQLNIPCKTYISVLDKHDNWPLY